MRILVTIFHKLMCRNNESTTKNLVFLYNKSILLYWKKAPELRELKMAI